MRLYCPPELIDEIIIVDNSAPGSRKWQSKLLYQYGDLASFVRLVPAASISAMPTETDGWLTQQVLKIEIASVVRSERYVILDAKNHLIAPLGREFLEAPTGQPWMAGKRYIGHPMQAFLERTTAYLGLDPQAYLKWFTRTDTPFTILTNEARELVSYVVGREAKPFATVFLDRKLSEFFLYSGFLESKGTLWQIYNLTQEREPQVWPENANEQGCAKAIQIARETGRPFMTVHRRAFAKLGKNGQRLIAEFWHARGLFASPQDGIRFFQHPNRIHQNYDGHVVSWPFSIIVSRFSAPAGVHSPRSADWRNS